MKHSEWVDSFFQVGELGLIMIISILCGLGLGIFLDKLFNTSFFTFVFIVFGVIGGFTGIYKTITKDARPKK